MYWINDDSDNWRCAACAVRGDSRHARRPNFSIRFSTMSGSGLKIWACETSISTRRAKPVVSTIWAYLRAPDLRESVNACKLFPCCRSASGSPPGSCEVGEWWWFENSRAYLYYFFIVNDCQFVAGHVRMVPRDRSNGGEVFVRCAFPYKAIVNFLISRVIVSMSLHEVFCRGFDSGSG